MKEKWSIYYWIVNILSAVFFLIWVMRNFQNDKTTSLAFIGYAVALCVVGNLVLRFVDYLHRNDK